MPDQQKNKRLSELEAKWLNGTITPEEEREYAAWYNEDDATEIKIGTEIAANEQEHKHRLLDNIAQRTYNKKAPLIRLLPRYAAAAVLLILTGITIYKYLVPNNVPAVATTQNVELPPGTDKAILTLSNGQKIELNNAASETINDGNLAIKNNNGALIYQGGEINSRATIHKGVMNTMTTPNGGKYKVNLPDGSQVWLNAASSITYPTVFSDNERKVSIKGEAYFDVAKNEKNPFIVDVNGQLDIQVLGTAFNVSAYQNENNIQTTLVQGKVSVRNNKKQVLLNPGEQSNFNGSGLTTSGSADIEKITAWKENKFIFEGDKLSAILRQLERWYDVEIIYEGKPSEELFSGIISRNKNVSEVFKMLQQAGNVKYRVAGKKIFIQP